MQCFFLFFLRCWNIRQCPDRPIWRVSSKLRFIGGKQSRAGRKRRAQCVQRSASNSASLHGRYFRALAQDGLLPLGHQMIKALCRKCQEPRSLPHCQHSAGRNLCHATAACMQFMPVSILTMTIQCGDRAWYLYTAHKIRTFDSWHWSYL